MVNTFLSPNQNLHVAFAIPALQTRRPPATKQRHEADLPQHHSATAIGRQLRKAGANGLRTRLPVNPLILDERLAWTRSGGSTATPVAHGYIDPKAWNKLNFEITKPVVEKKLLEGVYDAGVAYSRSALEHPDKLEIVQEIGEVVTTWLLYGPRPRYSGMIIASLYPELHDVLP